VQSACYSIQLQRRVDGVHSIVLSSGAPVVTAWAAGGYRLCRFGAKITTPALPTDAVATQPPRSGRSKHKQLNLLHPYLLTYLLHPSLGAPIPDHQRSMSNRHHLSFHPPPYITAAIDLYLPRSHFHYCATEAAAAYVRKSSNKLAVYYHSHRLSRRMSAYKS